MPDPDNSLAVPELAALAPRERTLAVALMNGASPADACRMAGYAEATLRAHSREICERDRIQSAIRQAMAAAGINAARLAAVLSDGLDAENPKTVLRTKDGAEIERGGGPDWSNRHRFLETALRIGGHEPARETTIETTYEDRIMRLRGDLAPVRVSAREEEAKVTHSKSSDSGIGYD